LQAFHADCAGGVLHEEQLEGAIDVRNRSVETDRHLRPNRLRRELAHLLDGGQRAA
jgi:hypothetical protein